MLAALLPLILDAAPQIGKWLFGSTGQEVTQDVVGLVQKVTGTTDEAEAERVLQADPAKMKEFQVQLAQIAAEREAAADKAMNDMMAQVVALSAQITSTNNAEAQSSSLFVAGWRPAVGWVCALGIMWAFIVGPSFSWIFSRPMVPIDVANLLILLQGLLGLAGLRTFEKIKGVSSDKVQ